MTYAPVDTDRFAPWGDQPWRQMIFDHRGYSLREIARRLDVKYGLIYGMAEGRFPPTQELRDLLVEILDKPQEELFSRAAIKFQLDPLDEGDSS